MQQEQLNSFDKIEINTGGDWQCICGNRPDLEGFYPCDTVGNQVEPTPEEWKANCYICDRCARIINSNTLEIVGSRKTTLVSS